VIPFSRLFLRVTRTPKIRLRTVTQLLAIVCSVRCIRHRHRASVQEVTNGRIKYAACCEDLLDRVEGMLPR
jgi:hypothetical protein